MDNFSTFKIRGTKVTSPYEVKLTPAETRLIFSLQKLFSPAMIFPDCYFPKPGLKIAPTSNADLLQVDCIAMNEQGIFVFESKDYSGWIYGNGKQIYWTEVLDYGKEKHRFYNPIKQNQTHITAITGVFPDTTPIYSVIVFGNNCTLKTLDDIPPAVTICKQENLRTILQKLKYPPKISLTKLEEYRNNLNAARINPTEFIRQNHINEIKERTRATS